MIHTKKLTIVLTVLLFGLVIALLVLVQKDADAQEQQKTQELINEFKQPTISAVVLFDGYDNTGKMLINEEYKFKKGNTVNVLVQISQITNPTTQEGKYVFGLKETAETTDENGNKATPFNGLVVDMDNYLKNKGDPITINNQFQIDNSITPGNYYLKITIYDKISKKETTTQPIQFEII